jgi:hypothetical protein
MCIYIFHQLRKWGRNRKAPEVPPKSEERRKAKQRPLCEHQLADATRTNSDGVSGSHKQPDTKEHGSEQCSICRAEQRRATIYRWKVLVSLLVPNIMASMDLTIIATALPTIASHFCELQPIY